MSDNWWEMQQYRKGRSFQVGERAFKLAGERGRGLQDPEQVQRRE